MNIQVLLMVRPSGKSVISRADCGTPHLRAAKSSESGASDSLLSSAASCDGRRPMHSPPSVLEVLSVAHFVLRHAVARRGGDSLQEEDGMWIDGAARLLRVLHSTACRCGRCGRCWPAPDESAGCARTISPMACAHRRRAIARLTSPHPCAGPLRQCEAGRATAEARAAAAAAQQAHAAAVTWDAAAGALAARALAARRRGARE